MPLIAEVKTTHAQIGNLTITRRGKDYSEDPDSVHNYIVRQDGIEIGHVRHRYGDGAWVLIYRALELVHDVKTYVHAQVPDNVKPIAEVDPERWKRIQAAHEDR